MNILYQYYNEIVLAFSDYLVDLEDSVIVIEVDESNKPFDIMCQKIHTQLLRIAQTLDDRDKDIVIRVMRNDEEKEITLGKH